MQLCEIVSKETSETLPVIVLAETGPAKASDPAKPTVNIDAITRREERRFIE
ncbi:hypothetical protein KaCgl_19700 [Corynebacterium glutamicum]|nr:hypothetical protein KaCgl_19700 [Corynebacterium glutamicum]